jgi:hypothetical protein
MQEENKNIILLSLPKEIRETYYEYNYTLMEINKQIFESLEEQQEYLLKVFKKGFVCLDPNAIILYNKKFYHVAPHLLTTYDDKLAMFKLFKLSWNGFLKEEIENAKSLPIQLSYWSYYHSINRFSNFDKKFVFRIQYLSEKKHKRVPIIFFTNK